MFTHLLVQFIKFSAVYETALQSKYLAYYFTYQLA